MHVRDLLTGTRPTFSFEFFPPRDEAAAETLRLSMKELAPLSPSFVSITYGAGGSTRQLTHDLVLQIHESEKLHVVPHLTCVGSTKPELGAALERYWRAGIRDIMALRGDPPAGERDFVPPADGFTHAADLVAFIRRDHPGFGIGVAGYPQGHHETPNRLKEMDHLKAKVDAGADYICTQLFFDNHIFYDFCDRCVAAGIHVPIIAGIMPITSLATMRRMSELALGVHIPGKLQNAIGRMSGRGSVSRIGVHWATEQVRDLMDHHVAGIHLYTLNQSRATLQIVETLGVL